MKERGVELLLVPVPPKAALYPEKLGTGYWEKKKIVIWCFASCEFTQSADKLIDIPLLRE